jgi:hypothetical protein
MATVTYVGPRLGIAPTCAALGLPRATYYRRRLLRVRPPGDGRPGPSARRSAPRCSTRSTSRDSWTWLPRKSMRPCSTRAGTSAPSGRCTASWRPTMRCGIGETSSGIPTTRPQNSWPAGPTNCGIGTSRSSLAQPKWTCFYLSQCRHENEAGAKFCEECAAPLARECAKCGRILSRTAKFCPECAHPTGSSAAPLPAQRFDSPESYTPKHLAERS